MKSSAFLTAILTLGTCLATIATPIHSSFRSRSRSRSISRSSSDSFILRYYDGERLETRELQLGDRLRPDGTTESKFVSSRLDISAIYYADLLHAPSDLECYLFPQDDWPGSSITRDFMPRVTSTTPFLPLEGHLKDVVGIHCEMDLDEDDMKLDANVGDRGP